MRSASRPSLRSLAPVTMALLAGSWPAWAAAPLSMPFETHAAFFSSETQQAKPIDPQVFVKDAAAMAATGPQGIKHAAGYRPAFIKDDPATTTLFNANGMPLGFNLGEWLAPTGSVTMTSAGTSTTLKMHFEHLRPSATYSVFENHFDQTPVGFPPMDGIGAKNTFKTDSHGAASPTVKAPQALTHANAVLVIYDDDGQTHGASRGDIGVTVQHQLIARPPG